MARTLLVAVAAGLAGALCFAGMLAMGPVAGAIPWFLSPVPPLAVGLALGPIAGALAAVVGLGAVALAAPASGAVLIYLLSDVVPVLLIVGMALRPAPGVTTPDPRRAADWTGPGRGVARLALVPPAVMVVVWLLAPGHVDGLEGLLREEIRAGFDRLLTGPDGAPMPPEPLTDEATRQAIVDSAVLFLPGAMAMSWLFRAVATTALAQMLVQRLGQARRPAVGLGDLDLPLWYGAAFVGVGLLAALLGGDAGYVAWSAAIGMALPFLLLGFKLVHMVARRTPQPMLILVAFYVVFLSVSGVAIVAMVLAGLVEFAVSQRRSAAGPAAEEK